MAREATNPNTNHAPLSAHPLPTDSDGAARHTPSHLLLTGDWADYHRSQGLWAAHHARLRDLIEAQRTAGKHEREGRARG